MILYKTICISILIILTGCVQSTPYIKPPPENSAIIELPAGNDYVFQYMENGNNCSDIKSFDSNNNPLKQKYRNFNVPSNKRIAINIASVVGLSSCNIIISFELPKSGRYRLKKDRDEKRCYLSLVKLINGGEQKAVDAKIKQMELKGFNNDRCEEIKNPI